jgi:YqaJ-like viral recombinase domain
VKIHNVKQGSPEWCQLRAGIPTTSAFDEVITRGGEASKSCTKYLHNLLAERVLGRPVTQYVSLAMSRGSQAEAEAVASYELQRGLSTEAVGFITNDAGTIGCSPDRLVGDEGLLEIKSPSEAVHIGYLLMGNQSDEYKQQIQGQLWITDRKWVDIMSYHPDMDSALVRVARDEDYIAKVAKAVATFVEHLEAKTERLRELGIMRPKLTLAWSARLEVL